MIISKGTKPENSLYYLGGKILEVMKSLKKIEFEMFELFDEYKKSNNSCSYNQYLLAIDWLYLLNLVIITSEGRLKKCF